MKMLQGCFGMALVALLALGFGFITVPARVDLELPKYVNNRGVKKLMFKAKHEIKDPFTGK